MQDAPKLKRQSESLDDTKKNTKDIEDNSVDTSDSDEASEEPKTRFRLPLQLDFDDLAGTLIAKNQK